MGRTLTVQQVADIIALELSPGDHVECAACGFSEGREIVGVIEHAMFGHGSRAGIDIIRAAPLMGEYELARLLGLDAQTTHEERWREQNPLT